MDKKALSESDICDKFIRPAMEAAGWDGLLQIFREYPLRAGYALFFKPNIPLAVVEAKDNQHAMGAGMGQAINYAQLLDVPFSFSSNGDGFVFRDATLASGVLERNLALHEFPSPAELWNRYCAWKGWPATVREVAEHDYAPSKTPRYYQLNAINRTVEAIAAGRHRVLLVMATGTGKGIGAKHVNVGDMRQAVIPVPPLAEQLRIVERVGILNRLCVTLRERLPAQQAAQSRFDEALVEQALA